MRQSTRRVSVVLAAFAFVVGLVALLAPGVALAGKPKPPSCPNCPATINVGGLTCTLSSCGFDCVYTCPFPH